MKLLSARFRPTSFVKPTGGNATGGADFARVSFIQCNTNTRQSHWRSFLRTLSFYQYVGSAIPRPRFSIIDESKDCFNRAFLLHIDKYRLMFCFRKVRLVTFTYKYEDHNRCRHHQRKILS